MNKPQDWLLPFTLLPHPREASKGNFSTEVFLHSVFTSALDLQDSTVFQVLDRLCKKLDVTRKLRVFYTPDLSRNARPLLNPQPEYLSFIAALLLSAAQNYRDPKFLNSVLKMLDNGLVEQAEHVSILQIWASQVLKELVP